MNKEELEKYIEKDFLPGLLSSLPNVPDLTGENARLKAEVERLTERLNRHLEINDELDARCTRLRKAGDAMADAIYEADPEKLEAHKKFKLTEEEYNAVQLWNSAKEGKQP